MKKTVLIISVFLPIVLGAQELTDAQKAALDAANVINGAKDVEPEQIKPRYWDTSLGFDLGFNQTGLVNWAAGGFHTISLAAGLDANANYARNLLSWNNRLQCNYGFMWMADKPNVLQKSNDRIYLESLFGYKTSQTSTWSYSASFDFRSQFSDTYNTYAKTNPDDDKSWAPKDLKSGLLSPANFNLALGMEWKPTKWFNMNLAPLTGGVVMVTNPELRKANGLKLIDSGKTYPEGEGPVGIDYRPTLWQFGAQLKFNFKVNVNEKFKFDTQLVYFTDYLDHPFAKSRVNWDIGISWQPVKFFKIGFNTWLIYDPNVSMTVDGVEKTNFVQFKEFLSLNFTYTLSHPRIK